MKLEKEFKNEVNKEFKEADYIGSKFAIRIVITIVLIGLLAIGEKYTLGKWSKNADREVFKQSIAYNESAAEFIAKSYAEYNQAESDDDKKAICGYVRDRYPNLDSSKIENISLRTFYENCVGGFY